MDYSFISPLYLVYSAHSVYSHKLPLCEEIDHFRLHVSGVLKSENVYSCTQCWHLKSGKRGYCNSSAHARIIFFSPSFHRPRPRRTKFPSNWLPAKSRWPSRWDPVQHKHSILFVGPANIKYLNWQG